MIERVARAIAQADEQNGGAPYDLRMQMGKHAKEHLFDQARAAIAAMRELPGEPGPRYTAGEYSRRTQEAMVDDALLGVGQDPARQ